ncbi:PepSY domain-containing protein [Bacillus sp. FJAT-27445]|uniref:PepSY domain-containing protein n=1 Tax=Bacillus sp. FJAT-27445 TaxID=1679166 RepID=UPI000743EFCD|nr:PepSY domain-containing protein [Bacillus sp. FJAT-27445]
MKKKFLAAGVIIGLVAGGTFAVGAAGKDDSVRKVEVEYERETEHGVSLIKKETDNIENAMENAAVISFEEAAKTAKEAVKGIIKEAEVELEHGRVEYEFELEDGKTETEVKIDGTTGKILEIDIDDDDGHDDDGELDD